MEELFVQCFIVKMYQRYSVYQHGWAHLGTFRLRISTAWLNPQKLVLWCMWHRMCFQASYQHFRSAGLHFTHFSSWPARILANMLLWTWSPHRQMVRASLGFADEGRQQIDQPLPTNTNSPIWWRKMYDRPGNINAAFYHSFIIIGASTKARGGNICELQDEILD